MVAITADSRNATSSLVSENFQPASIPLRTFGGSLNFGKSCVVSTIDPVLFSRAPRWLWHDVEPLGASRRAAPATRVDSSATWLRLRLQCHAPDRLRHRIAAASACSGRPGRRTVHSLGAKRHPLGCTLLSGSTCLGRAATARPRTIYN